VFSYITEPNIGESRSVATQLTVSKQFASVVKSNCQKLGLIMGIPSDWIYQNRFDLISAYIESLQENDIHVDYWLSDEVINGMINHGMTLESATQRASNVISFIENKSHVKYIWIEPGNYGPKYAGILDNLGNIKGGIKAYDQYLISRYGSLKNSGKAFNVLNNTLIKLKNKNQVFPVCEIAVNKNNHIEPTEQDLRTILISLYLNGANGFIFWEERWTTNNVLAALRQVILQLKTLEDVGQENIKLISINPEIWSIGKQKLILINRSESDILSTSILAVQSMQLDKVFKLDKNNLIILNANK
jgi:hypothetical protein